MWLAVIVASSNILCVQAVGTRKPGTGPLLRSAIVSGEGSFLNVRSEESSDHIQHLRRYAKEEQTQDPTPLWTMPGLPTNMLVQDGVNSITKEQWPSDFCVNVKVQAPDASDDSQPIKGLALLGGTADAPDGDGKGRCGYFYLCFLPGNAPAMGVQCDGGGSDTPLGAGKNLTSFTDHDISFCYSTASQEAFISIDKVLVASARKNFVFPREGQVSVLTGSHSGEFEQTDGVKLTSLGVVLLLPPPTTTTTTTFLTTTSIVTLEGTENYQLPSFALQLMPRTVPSMRTATINDQQWPPDFCITTVITTPLLTTGTRCIALIGGAGHCGSFMVFFGEKNTVGMGVQCNGAGSEPPLESAVPVASGTHALQFCYAKIEGTATISVDGQLLTSDKKNWNYPGHGNVSVMVGSHVNNTQALGGVTLESLSITSRNPFAPALPPTDASGNPDVTVTLAPPMDPTYGNYNNTWGINGKNISGMINGTVPFTGVIGGNATQGHNLAGAPAAAQPDGPSTTATTTTTTTIIVEHKEFRMNTTNVSGVTRSHQRSATDTVTHDDTSKSTYKHVEAR